jgi:hypothetical protein
MFDVIDFEEALSGDVASAPDRARSEPEGPRPELRNKRRGTRRGDDSGERWRSRRQRNGGTGCPDLPHEYGTVISIVCVVVARGRAGCRGVSSELVQSRIEPRVHLANQSVPVYAIERGDHAYVRQSDDGGGHGGDARRMTQIGSPPIRENTHVGTIR